MPCPHYVERLRRQLRETISERDTTGLTDAVAARLNDLECRIAWADRAHIIVVKAPWWRVDSAVALVGWRVVQ